MFNETFNKNSILYQDFQKVFEIEISVTFADVPIQLLPLASLFKFTVVELKF